MPAAADPCLQLPRFIRFGDSTTRPEPIWGKSKTAGLKTLDEDDLDCDHMANVDLETGHGIKHHKQARVQLRNYVDAGMRTYWESNRVYSACLNRRWNIPGNDDDRIVAEQRARLVNKPLEEVVPQLAGQKPLVNMLWVRAPSASFVRCTEIQRLTLSICGRAEGRLAFVRL